MFKFLFVKFCFIFTFVCFSLPSFAGLVFEPQFGYAKLSGDMKMESDLGNFEADIDESGLMYGAKLLYQTQNQFQFGVDYNTGSFGSGDEKVEKSDISALIAKRFWYARVYAGYVFNSKVKDLDEAGSGFKAGLTFYALRHLALSVEYSALKYDIKDDDTKVNINQVALIASFPFGN